LNLSNVTEHNLAVLKVIVLLDRWFPVLENEGKYLRNGNSHIPMFRTQEREDMLCMAFKTGSNGDVVCENPRETVYCCHFNPWQWIFLQNEENGWDKIVFKRILRQGYPVNAIARGTFEGL